MGQKGVNGCIKGLGEGKHLQKHTWNCDLLLEKRPVDCDFIALFKHIFNYIRLHFVTWADWQWLKRSFIIPIH